MSTASSELQSPTLKRILDIPITRRRVNTLLLAGTFALATGSHQVRAQETTEPEVLESQETTDLKRSLEEKFGIVLPIQTDIDEYNKAKGANGTEQIHNYNLPDVSPWDLERLLFLEKCLDFLPPHFSSPNDRDTLSIYLANSDINEKIQGGFVRGENRSFILLNPGVFDPYLPDTEVFNDYFKAYDIDKRIDAVKSLTHEGIHRLDPHLKEGDRDEPNPEIDKIFADSFAANSPYVVQQVEENWAKLSKDNPDIARSLLFTYGKLRTVLKDPTPHELVAFLGECRIEGKSFISEKLGLLLSKLLTEQLDSYINLHFFPDWEKDSYHQLLAS